MMDYSEATEIAGRMLGCEAAQLHHGFISYLTAIEGLVDSTQGRLGSRQVIAHAIMNWEMHTGERAKAE